MTLDPQLQLRDVFPRHSFIVKLEELLSYNHWVDVYKLLREQHRSISVELFEHRGVAVLQTVEQDFDLLEDVLFRLRWVDPFSQLIEKLFLVNFAIFFAAQVGVYLRYAS